MKAQGSPGQLSLAGSRPGPSSLPVSVMAMQMHGNQALTTFKVIEKEEKKHNKKKCKQNPCLGNKSWHVQQHFEPLNKNFKLIHSAVPEKNRGYKIYLEGFVR